MNPKLFTAEKPLKVKVKKITEGSVELVFSDQQSVNIKVKFLPQQTKEGDTLYLDLLSADQLKLARQEVARAVLEEILDSPNVHKTEDKK